MPQRILAQNYNTFPTFLTIMRTKTATYTNSSGSSVTLAAGRLMGRILASGKVAPQSCTATDGSEMPIGVLMEGVTVADGDSATVTYAFEGEILESQLGLAAGQTLDDIVRTVSTGGGILRDLIVRDTFINVIPATDLTEYDNAVS